MMRRLLNDNRGAAAAEMALVTPLLLLLLAVGVETGYYFYTENRLLESVRDASRYAARQDFATYSPCPAAGTSATIATTAPIYLQSRQLARKGTIDLTIMGETGDRIWGWDETGESFVMTYTCNTTVSDGAGGNVAVGGIYTSQVDGAPVVTVSASLPHRPVFAFAGFAPGLEINATQQSAVAGI